MKTKHNAFNRLSIFWLGLAVAIGSIIWIQASVSPVAAQEPVDLTVHLEGFGAAAVESVPVFNVGDRFNISIMAENVTDPGIFGSQFEINYDVAHLQAVEGSIVSGTDMEPVLIAVANFNPEMGVVSWAASRQGDVDNLSGSVVLATLTMEAMAATEPPEGQTTAITLDNVKLGSKGGIEVPVNGLVGLEVIIRDDGTIPGRSDIAGAVTVEGRTADNQAGHSVMAAGMLGSEFGETTNDDGSFLFNNIPADTYMLTADSPGFLAAMCEGVVHAADALTTLTGVNLLAGDIDGNGMIDITDAVAIGTVFGSAVSGEVADLNMDGVVDILDLILMAVNYGQTSDGNPWVCQPAG